MKNIGRVYGDIAYVRDSSTGKHYQINHDASGFWAVHPRRDDDGYLWVKRVDDEDAAAIIAMLTDEEKAALIANTITNI